MVYERHVPPVELGASSRIAAPAEPFRIVMRRGPYKPRLPRDRKLWPVVFSLLRVSTTILGSSLLQNLPRASRPMRKRTADDVIPPCHPPLSLCVSRSPCSRKRCSFFPSIVFGYRGINFLSLPSRIWPLGIVRRKRIPFSSVRTLRLENFWVYASRCHLVARRGYREISIISMYRSPISTLKLGMRSRFLSEISKISRFGTSKIFII